ncbi:MAG TPA: polysaccharide deacetylase family protein, partial [Candidatus Caenarcaniphilales bacterium]|nr:polysaccharide deacetylase family protein [Candidatus Caenarcaniphilales bacterium]
MIGLRSAVTHGRRDVPAIALTFDDGPGALTPAILDVLERHAAQATFNVLGDRVVEGTATIRRAVGAGHEIGVH